MVALMQQFMDPNKKTKMRADDRVFILKLIDDKAPISSTGLVDKRLFSGENKLHVIRDEASTFLWYFKYERGELPDYFKGRKYTKFIEAQKDAVAYFAKRNIRIEEVVD